MSQIETYFKPGLNPFAFSGLDKNEDLLITPGICVVTNKMINDPNYFVWAVGFKWLYWNVGFYYMKKTENT